jgi:hypothetical protein
VQYRERKALSLHRKTQTDAQTEFVSGASLAKMSASSFHAFCCTCKPSSVGANEDGLYQARNDESWKQQNRMTDLVTLHEDVYEPGGMSFVRQAQRYAFAPSEAGLAINA